MKQKGKKNGSITGTIGGGSSNYPPGFASNDESTRTDSSSEQFHSLSTLEKQDDLRASLPKEIQLAIKEWAASLSKLSWKLRIFIHYVVLLAHILFFLQIVSIIK